MLCWNAEEDLHDVHVFHSLSIYTVPLNCLPLEVKSRPLMQSFFPTLCCIFCLYFPNFIAGTASQTAEKKKKKTHFDFQGTHVSVVSEGSVLCMVEVEDERLMEQGCGRILQ